MLFGGMGKEVCECGAWVKDTFFDPICGHVMCKWCEEDHDDSCDYLTDVCPDHPCERCMDRHIDSAMNRFEDYDEDAFIDAQEE